MRGDGQSQADWAKDDRPDCEDRRPNPLFPLPDPPMLSRASAGSVSIESQRRVIHRKDSHGQHFARLNLEVDVPDEFLRLHRLTLLQAALHEARHSDRYCEWNGPLWDWSDDGDLGDADAERCDRTSNPRRGGGRRRLILRSAAGEVSLHVRVSVLFAVQAKQAVR